MGFSAQKIRMLNLYLYFLKTSYASTGVRKRTSEVLLYTIFLYLPTVYIKIGKILY